MSLKMEGYKARTYPLMNHANPVWVCVDGFLLWVPALVDMLTGAWYEFDQKSIFIELEEKPESR